MSAYEVMHHSGWPWPLDAVQDWFEGLWTTVSGIADGAAKAVMDALPEPFWKVMGYLRDLGRDVWDKMIAFFKDPVGSVKAAFDALFTGIRDLIGWYDVLRGRFVGGFLGWLWDQITGLGSALAGFGAFVWETVSSGLGWLRDVASGWIQGSLKWVSDSLVWLRDEVSDMGSWIASNVQTAFDGAVSSIQDGISSALAGIPSAFGDAVKGVIDWFWSSLVPALSQVAGFLKETVLLPIWGGLTWLWDWILNQARGALQAVIDLFAGHSPITPEEAFNLAPLVLASVAGIGLAATGITSVAGIKILGSGIEVGEIGSYIKDLINPQMFTGAVIGTLLTVGLTTPLRQYYAQLFRTTLPPEDDVKAMMWRGKADLNTYRDILARAGLPEWAIEGYVDLASLIPGPSDLINFVVREVIPTEDFYKWMPMQGFSEYWAKAYWAAHWVLPAATVVFDAYHRKAIPVEDLETYLVLHDYSPEPRPGISKSDVDVMKSTLKSLIPRVDLRYAWEYGRLTDEDLVRWYELLGYEEDAPLMAEIQMARALGDELTKVRDEWIRDFIEGYILEETLRANLAALNISLTRIEFYATYARKRREREYKKELLTVYRDGYLKDLITDEDLEARAREILADPEAVNLYLQAAYTRKYQKPKAV